MSTTATAEPAGCGIFLADIFLTFLLSGKEVCLEQYKAAQITFTLKAKSDTVQQQLSLWTSIMVVVFAC